MTAKSKFVFQTASPVREQSVQNVVLVPQNPLKQIVVHIFSEFGCCHDIGTAWSLLGMDSNRQPFQPHSTVHASK